MKVCNQVVSYQFTIDIGFPSNAVLPSFTKYLSLSLLIVDCTLWPHRPLDCKLMQDTQVEVPQTKVSKEHWWWMRQLDWHTQCAAETPTACAS